MSRGYKIFPRSQDFRDNWDQTFKHGKSKDDRHTMREEEGNDGRRMEKTIDSRAERVEGKN